MASDETEAQLAQEIATNLRERRLDERVYGAPRAARGKWASAISLISATSGDKLSYFELPQDENAKWFDFFIQKNKILIEFVSAWLLCNSRSIRMKLWCWLVVELMKFLMYMTLIQMIHPFGQLEDVFIHSIYQQMVIDSTFCTERKHHW